MVSVTELDDDDPRGARSSRGAGPSSRFGFSSPTDDVVVVDDDDHDDAIEEERPDLYAVLGVDANATERDITRAYRMKAMQAHPDRRRGAAGKKE